MKPSATPLAQALGAGKPRARAPKTSAPMPADLAASLDVLEEARQTLVLCMRGEGGRGAQTRARCAELLLGKRFLQELTDADLLAEVKRRALRPTDG